jgi:hypothetical protein
MNIRFRIVEMMLRFSATVLALFAAALIITGTTSQIFLSLSRVMKRVNTS